MGQWISVEESLPCDGQRVLIYGKSYNFGRKGCGMISIVGFYDEGGFSHTGYGRLCITHWQPLPEPPKP